MEKNIKKKTKVKDPLMNKKKKIWPIVLSVVGVCILAAVAYAVIVLNFYKPKVDNAPKFDTPEQTGPANNNADSNVKESKYNFLVMGHDRVAGLTDVIMIISYDTEDQSVSLMQIPRDTYIELDDYYYHKINGAYSYYIGTEKEKKSDHPEIDASRDFANLLEKSLCIKIHYTAVMDLDGFANIVDSIGGVEMYVPQDMDYEAEDQNLFIHLKEGNQRLNGDTAEQFVRCRNCYPNADLGRGDAQKLFMAAFIKQLKSSVSLTDVGKLTSLATNVSKSIITDMSVNDMVYFGKSFLGYGGKQSVELDKINMLTMPGSAFSDGLSYYMVNKAAITDVINKYFNIYDFDISSSFDKDKIFVKEDNEKAQKVYNMPKEELKTQIYNADQLDKNGVN